MANIAARTRHPLTGYAAAPAPDTTPLPAVAVPELAPYLPDDWREIYSVFRRVTTYAMRELTGQERTNALEAVDAAMNRYDPADAVRDLRAVGAEIGMVA